jgi:hypothetical protein
VKCIYEFCILQKLYFISKFSPWDTILTRKILGSISQWDDNHIEFATRKFLLIVQ